MIKNIFHTGFFSKNQAYPYKNVFGKPMCHLQTQYYFKILLEPKSEPCFAVYCLKNLSKRNIVTYPS